MSTLNYLFFCEALNKLKDHIHIKHLYIIVINLYISRISKEPLLNILKFFGISIHDYIVLQLCYLKHVLKNFSYN